MSTDKDIDSVISKLEIIINLLASNLVEGKSQTEAILTLGKLGLDRNQISSVTGATASTVSVRLSEAKKKGKKS
jgi:hypothetical protein